MNKGGCVKKSLIPAVALVLGLGGCAAIDPTFTAFTTEAGGGNANTDFGAATVNNMLVQQGAHAAIGTAEAPAGAARLLNGKYAAAVIEGYRASAEPATALKAATITTGSGQ